MDNIMNDFDLYINVAEIVTNNLLDENIQNFNNNSKWNSLSHSDNSTEVLLQPINDEDLEFYLKQHFYHCNNNAPQKVINEFREISTNKNNQNESNNDDTSNGSKIKGVTGETNKLTDVDLLNKFNNIEFEDYLHMSKLSFLKIFQFIRSILESNKFPKAVSPQTVFSLALWKLATDEDFEGISRRFFMPLNECRLLIREFERIVSDNYETYIRWPNSLLSQRLQLSGFQQHANLKTLTNLFGIITLRCLNVFLIEEDAEFPIILQIICNADQKIVDCFVELKQNYVFDKSPMGQLLSTSVNSSSGLPKDGYLIGNMCFPLYQYLMRPFVTPKSKREKQFNGLLETAIGMANETIEVMAKRFNILYALEASNLSEVRQILESICALHNLSMAIEDDYVERKRQTMKLKWAGNEKSTANLQIGNEDVAAQQKRYELMDILVPS